MAVVFVVSAAAHLTESDCALLDAAAEHTDVVVGMVSKIDVHRAWRDTLSRQPRPARRTCAALRPGAVDRRGRGARAGRSPLDELVDTVSAQLAVSDVRTAKSVAGLGIPASAVAQRFDRDVDGAGRRARVGRAARGAQRCPA